MVKISPELIKLLVEEDPNAPMQSRIVKNLEEFDAVVAEFEVKGFRVGAQSNTGLPFGQTRVTFFHESCFKKDDSAPEESI